MKEETLEEASWKFIKKEQDDKCQYCGLENDNHKLSCPVIKITILL
jgi:hypothetical protein